MAKMRAVQVKFWLDPYVEKLTIHERYLFLYLITNPHTNLTGMYELGLRRMSFETLMTEDELIKILARFRKDEKIYYQGDWIIIKNFIKNQKLNPSIRVGIDKELDALPEWLKNWVIPTKEDNQLTLTIQSGDSLPTDSPQSATIEANLIKSNLIKSNSNKTKGFKNLEKPKPPGLLSERYRKVQEQKAKLGKDKTIK